MATCLKYFVFFFQPLGRYVETVFGANALQTEVLYFFLRKDMAGDPHFDSENIARGDR